MNKIITQSLLSIIIIYFGVVIGFINSIYLFPKFLAPEQIGLIRQIINLSSLLIPLTTFGVGAGYLKYYPLSKDNTSKNELLSFFLITILICYFLVAIFFQLFENNIKNLFTSKSEILFQYYSVIFLILLIMSLSSLIEAFLRARYDITLSNFSNGVSNRLLTGLSIILFSFSLLSFQSLIWLQIPIYLFGLLILIKYAFYKEKFFIKINLEVFKKFFNKISNFSFFSILISFGNIIIQNIDILLISALLGLSETGIYTTAFYIGIVIEMPRRVISQISMPIISNLFNENKLNTIKKYYKSVSVNQLIIGLILYIVIMINLENIFNIIPNKENFIAGKGVVVFIGLAKLINMCSSFGNELIMMSKYYRFNLITIIILAIITISLNIILIPIYGIIGAAYSALISAIFFNLIKIFFIKLKIGFTPFSKNTIIIIIVGLIVYYISLYLPSINNILLDIIIRSFFTIIIFIIPIYLLRLSKEFNQIINNFIPFNHSKW